MEGLDLLSGVRVVDLTSTLSGPYATLLLRDLGAEVVKVEAPGGDTYRDLGPRVSQDMGAMYLNVNRGKRSVVIDLRTDEGRARLVRLAADSDVFVHNLRPDAARRWGADAETLRAHHPALVHCAIRGYGPGGPYEDRPAYDDTIQAASGIAAMQAWVAGEPQYLVTAVADKVTGLTAAFAIAAALRRREATGEGCAIDLPMFETITAFGVLEHLWGRTFVPQTGVARYPRISTPARRPYRTMDGWIAAVVYTTPHWRSFFELIGEPELIDDERYATLHARSVHMEELVRMLSETLATATTDEWLARLLEAGIPASRYAEVEDIFDDPHLRAVGLFREVEHPSEGTLLQIPFPVVFDGRRADAGPPAAHLGADTDDVFGDPTD